jgi:integrase
VSKSTSSRASRKDLTKPEKPYPEFPLYAHPLGYWSKKVDGKILHFGRWGKVVKGVVNCVEDQEAAWKEALRLYQSRIDDVKGGDAGPGTVVEEKGKASEGMRVKELCDRFLLAKRDRVNAGELTQRMWGEYKIMTDLTVKQFGGNTLVEKLTPDHFSALRNTMVNKGTAGDGWGPHRVTNGITRIKSIFKFGFEMGLLKTPVVYGQGFAPPSRSVMRRHRAKVGVKMFEAAELRQMIDGKTVEREGKEPIEVKPEPMLKAMILLGVNCGFGNGDCAQMTFTGLDLDGGWIDFPRPKTGIQRRCPLWPETVAAIREAIAVRPKPAELSDCGLVFLNYRGTAWVRVSKEKNNRSDYLSQAFNRYLKQLGLAKDGFGFYTLRHVFRTIADGARDIPAVRSIMGHVDAGIDAVYRERIEDERLQAVSEHVRKWLWLRKEEQKPG